MGFLPDVEGAAVAGGSTPVSGAQFHSFTALFAKDCGLAKLILFRCNELSLRATAFLLTFACICLHI
jgi:hypothetical protein